MIESLKAYHFSLRLHKLIADSTIEIIEGADPLVYLSKPEEFNQLVLEFLTKQV